jgi:RecA-family ATPase
MNDESIDINTIRSMEHKPLRYAIDGILPHGLFILAGSPKVGKSWLVLDICIAVATGGDIWGYRANQNGVLYYALEDNWRRINDRVTRLDTENTDMQGLRVKLYAPGISTGLLEEIDHHMTIYPTTGLIVVDTFEHIRNRDTKSQTLYSADYNDIKALRSVTNKYETTLLLVHHTRKMNDENDPINNVSGSTGLTGATDGNWVLEKVKRTENHAKLTIDNRDTEGFCFDLKFNPDTCHWEYVGNNTNLDNADEDIAILVDDFLQTEWHGTATELCKAFQELDAKANITPTNLAKQLRRIDSFLQKEFRIEISFKKSGSVKTIALRRAEGAI